MTKIIEVAHGENPKTEAQYRALCAKWDNEKHECLGANATHVTLRIR